MLFAVLFVYNLAVRRLDEEVRLTNFTISATLEENKDLTITKTAPQNQGENETSCILVTVPHSLVSGYEFYLEFLCPSNKKYLSPVLSKYEETETGVVYDCLIPACVLGEEGLVMFQLVARSDMDKSVVLKSNFSRKTSFFVRPSVNATEKTLRIDDYFASMQEKVDGFEEQLNTAQLNISNKVSFKKQSLSETEKQQARENIGAGTSNFSGSYNDLEDKPDIPQNTVSFQAQSLSDAEKQQARQNIGAGTSNFSGSYNDLTDKPAGGGGVTSWGNATGDIVLGDGFYFNDDNKAETLISGTYFSNIIAPNSNYAIAPIYPAVIFMRIQLDITYSSELVITIKSQGVDREYRVPVPSNAMNFCASIYKDHLATSIRGTFFDSDNVKTGENVELFGTISFREPIRICVSSHDSAGLFMTYYVIYKNDSTI